MGAITKFFLQAKHWQIFVLLGGTYLAGQVAILSILPSTSGSSDLVLKDLKDSLRGEAAMLPFRAVLFRMVLGNGVFPQCSSETRNENELRCLPICRSLRDALSDDGLATFCKYESNCGEIHTSIAPLGDVLPCIHFLFCCKELGGDK
jgi:hypothetical protein